ncbi:unnamed protein product [Didymodactylos carnosus]|uniref:Uncharacterized protein n=1 Tax=Didymodactylos carnosus TaxID=1234261 RepID=A0A814FGM2_9BILA|nr:unnamed protein product [Didymodactylos carnosus]CAF3755197.1 unnamed protein product [Didymodactylos carnosus]
MVALCILQRHALQRMSVLSAPKSTTFSHSARTFQQLPSEKRTPLTVSIPKCFNVTFAIQHGYFRCVRYLLELGYDPNERDSNLRTTLILCAYIENAKWRLSLAQNLLEKGARIALDDHARRNSLHHACALQREELVKLYLTCLDFNIEAKDCEGCTCLHYAAITGNCQIAEMLVDAAERKGIKLDQYINKEGCSAAVLALKYGHIDCANTITHRDSDEFFVVPRPLSIFELPVQNDKKDSKTINSSKQRRKSNIHPTTLSFGLLKIIFNDFDTNYSTRLHDMVEENRLADNNRQKKKLIKNQLRHDSNTITLDSKGYTTEFLRLKTSSCKSINEHASTEALVNQERKTNSCEDDQQPQQSNGERLSPRLQLMLQQHPHLGRKSNINEDETISSAISMILQDKNEPLNNSKTNNRPKTAKIDVLVTKVELQKQPSAKKVETSSDNYLSELIPAGTAISSFQTINSGKMLGNKHNNSQASVNTFKPFSTTETTDFAELQPSSNSFVTTSMKSMFSEQRSQKPSSIVQIKNLDQPSRLNSAKPLPISIQEKHTMRIPSSLKRRSPSNYDKSKSPTSNNIILQMAQQDRTHKYTERVRSAPLVAHKQIPFHNNLSSDKTYSQMLYAGRPISAVLHTSATRTPTPLDNCTIREAKPNTLYNNPEELFGLNPKDLFGTHIQPVIVSKTTPKDSDSERNRMKRNFHKQQHLWKQDIDKIIDLYNIHHSSTYRPTVLFVPKPTADNEPKSGLLSTRRNSIMGSTTKKLLQRNPPRSKISTLAQLNLTRRSSVVNRPPTIKVVKADGVVTPSGGRLPSIDRGIYESHVFEHNHTSTPHMYQPNDQECVRLAGKDRNRQFRYFYTSHPSAVRIYIRYRDSTSTSETVPYQRRLSQFSDRTIKPQLHHLSVSEKYKDEVRKMYYYKDLKCFLPSTSYEFNGIKIVGHKID